jgi:hypothetical protein
MIHPGDIAARDKEIDNLLISGEIEGALLRLIDFATDFGNSREHRNEAIAQIAQYKRRRSEMRQGLLSEQIYFDSETKVIHKCFWLKDAIISVATRDFRT